jgi:hypothetical protein
MKPSHAGDHARLADALPDRLRGDENVVGGARTISSSFITFVG